MTKQCKQCEYCLFFQTDAYNDNECFFKIDNNKCLNFWRVPEYNELEEPEDY